MHVSASVFKAYDIRGIVGKTIDETLRRAARPRLRQQALAAGEKRGGGRPRRPAARAPRSSAALMRGLASTGIDVVDLGPVTTPMLYYVAATRARHGCRSGIQVTGSHNPKDYNGFKMVLAGRAIYGDEIQRLRRRMEAEDYVAGRGRTRRWTSSPSTAPDRRRLQAGAADDDRGRLGQRHRRRVGAGMLRALGCTVARCTPRSTATSRTTTPTRASPRTWPSCSPRPERRRRARPRLRRRRRPARRRHEGRRRSSIPIAS